MGSAGSPYRTAAVVVPPPPPKRWYVRQFGPYGVLNVPVGIAIGATIGEIARHAGILDWPIVALSIPAAFVFWWRRAAEKPADGVLSRWILAPLPWRPRE